MIATTILLKGPDDRAGFWHEARAALAAGASPEDIHFVLPSDERDLFAATPDPELTAQGRACCDGTESAVDGVEDSTTTADREIPAELFRLVDGMLLHVAPERFALAYCLLWRARALPALALIASDPDVAKAADLGKSVRRDMHKMTAFVRFRAQEVQSGAPQAQASHTAPIDLRTRYVAWFEPAHHIVRAVAPFFVARFTGMPWSILTPRCSAHWDGGILSFSGGGARADAPKADPMEEVWRTYYGSTFNPARLKVKAMTAQMPKKYWHNLPEAEMIAPLVRAALGRSTQMLAAAPTPPRSVRRPAAAQCPTLPREPQLTQPTPMSPARAEEPPPQVSPIRLSACTRCSLHTCATQAVAGEGPAGARLMLVGEQPGDAEDLAGRPFVGPAGRLLATALERAGIDREACYLTNAVKHFKFEPRGKRRIHKSPSRQEIDQCRWWLDQERAQIKPRVIVALGVSAVRSITGAQVKLSQMRSRPIVLDDETQLLATVHPAFLLRLTSEAQKRVEWKQFLADLRLARELAD